MTSKSTKLTRKTGYSGGSGLRPTPSKLIQTPGNLRRLKPDRQALLDDNIAALASEARKLRRQSDSSEERLSPRDIDQLVKISDVSARLVRADMEHEKFLSPEEWSTEELVMLAEGAREVLMEDGFDADEDKGEE